MDGFKRLACFFTLAGFVLLTAVPGYSQELQNVGTIQQGIKLGSFTKGGRSFEVKRVKGAQKDSLVMGPMAVGRIPKDAVVMLMAGRVVGWSVKSDFFSVNLKNLISERGIIVAPAGEIDLKGMTPDQD